MAKASAFQIAEGPAILLEMRPWEAWFVLTALQRQRDSEPLPMTAATTDHLIGLLEPLIAPEGSDISAVLAALRLPAEGGQAG